MQNDTPNWADDVDQFFKNNPRREFYVRDADAFELILASMVFEFLGYASKPITGNDIIRITAEPNPVPLPVVIRRASVFEGRPKHEVIALDGGIVPPPFVGKKAPDKFGRWVFDCCFRAGAEGRSLVQVIDASDGRPISPYAA
jgi:hypothetical protein